MAPARLVVVAGLALVAGGCATGPARTPARPAPVVTIAPHGTPPAPASAPAAAPLPPAGAGDEAFAGVRFGATRADVQLAYPAADCASGHCLGALTIFGMPASFVVFAQPDGRWVASVVVTDATPAAKAFAQASAALRDRHQAPTDVEQGGNQLRWRLDRDGLRQVVLRRCTTEQKCRGAPHSVVEIDYFAKGTPQSQPW